MSERVSSLWIAAGLCLALCGTPAVAGAQDLDAFREELAGFFGEIQRHSPTVLGPLAGEAETLRRHVEAIPDGELEALQRAFAAVPDWRMAPEMLAASVPGSTRLAVEQAMQQAVQEAGKLREFRAGLETRVAAMRLVPASALQRTGMDAAGFAAAGQTVQQATPGQLARARAELADNRGWQALEQAVPQTFDPVIRRGALALARRGDLAPAEVRGLDVLRQEIDGFLGDLERLPRDVDAPLDGRAIARLRGRLASATPEALFVLREQLDSPELRRVMRDVHVLAGLDALDPAARAGLDDFRVALVEAFSVDSPQAPALQARAAQVRDADLILLQARIGRIPGWQTMLPQIVEAAASPAVRAAVEQLRHGVVNDELLVDLARFRSGLTEHFAALPGPAGEGQWRAAAVAQGLERADLLQLAVLQQVLAASNGDVSAGTLLDVQSAIEVLQPEILAASGLLEAGSCSIPSVGSIGGQCLSIPGCDFCPSVCVPSLSLPGINLQFVCDAFAPLEDLINGAADAVGAIDAVIDGILSVVDDIVSVVSDLPGLVLDGLGQAFEFIAQASGLANYLDPASLAGALGLTGSFWNSIPQVPLPPCPADGSALPAFGEVGESSTAARYSKYVWLFDKILELIPDTEISLTVKIPAQVLYGGVQYLELCLDHAAGVRDELDQTAFRDSVDGGLAQMQADLDAARAEVGVVRVSLASHAAVAAASVAALDLQTAAALGDVGALDQQVAGLQDGIAANITEAEDLGVRLRIEDDLRASGVRRINTFQLPESLGGFLDRVREIVAVSIDNADLAGLNVSNAEAQFQQGDDQLALGNYKAAYDAYRAAYRAAIRDDRVPSIRPVRPVIPPRGN